MHAIWRCLDVILFFHNCNNLVTYSQVLMYLGPDALKEAIENAELYPIRGLFNFRSYFDEIDAYYHRSLGYDTGVSTGWNNLNEFYNVRAVFSIFFNLRFCCIFVNILFLRDTYKTT